ncbi:MAG: GNAT family N-acetyltransferase [Lewinellaceae bacterium]|nr:GNAT family N-acetyltransferase [Phaeodactylibacter sp.]MCB0614667.1 GNAT family N-acetyltransferase [Phaeodactylibacter sp.]MCB9346361.1 GNAT family N-acetyltransferase [Lewinellaceae bacterium]
MLDKTDYIQPSMQKYDNIKVIALDADDTLWVNEPIFQQTQDKLKEVLSAYIEPEQLDERLYETERENLRLFGYGVKGFVLSMIETAVQLSEGKITGGEVRQIIDMGKAMLEHPVDLLDGVKETVETLSEYYELMVITKGDLFDQENKVARSGLAEYFKRVEIVSEKDEATYREIFNRNGIPLDEVLMVGNSLKSDVLPICELGGKAIHIPFHTTWQHEKVERRRANGYDYDEIDNLRQLIRLLNPKKSPALNDRKVLIEGRGFRLRRFTPADTTSLAYHANNANIAVRLQDRFPHPYTEQDARQFIEYALHANMETVFAIEVDGEAAGAVGIIFQKDVYSQSGELGYWLGEGYWGRGIVSQTVKAIVRHAFNDLGLRRVYARIFSNNMASKRVLEKAGFQFEGMAKQAVVKNEEVLDVFHYAILNPRMQPDER